MIMVTHHQWCAGPYSPRQKSIFLTNLLEQIAEYNSYYNMIDDISITYLKPFHFAHFLGW